MENLSYLKELILTKIRKQLSENPKVKKFIVRNIKQKINNNIYIGSLKPNT